MRLWLPSAALSHGFTRAANGGRQRRRSPASFVGPRSRVTATDRALRALRCPRLLSTGENEGDKETLGRIADLYAELNDFDNAGVYYDKARAVLAARCSAALQLVLRLCRGDLKRRSLRGGSSSIAARSVAQYLACEGSDRGL